MSFHYRSIEEMLVATSEAIRPSERLTVSEAAAKYRKLDNPGSYKGPWLNEKTPYLCEPMDILTSKDFVGMVFVGPAQCGKTDMLLNWITHSVICDPSDLMVVQTTMTLARDFSKRRMDKLFRQSQDVGSRRAPGRQNQNVMDTTFTSGMYLTSSWPTLNELSGKPIPRVWLTDYDRMPEDIDTNGSPFDLSRARTKTFKRFGMTVAESSPGRLIDDPRWKRKTPHEAPPTTGILSLYNRGDRRRFLWDCPQCQLKFEPDFIHMRWPDVGSIIEKAEQACMVCPECSFPITEDLRNEMNITGRWIKDGQTWQKNGRVTGESMRSDIASFWLMGPAAALGEWRTLVGNYLAAEKEFFETGSQEALKTTVNTDQGKPYMLVGVTDIRLPENLKEKQIDIPMGVVPEWARFLVGTVDIQKNRFVCQVQAYGVNGDVHVVDRFDIKTSKRLDESAAAEGQFYWISPGSYLEDWDHLIDGMLTKTYPIEGTTSRMAMKVVGCDSGGKEGVTKNAYEFWRVLRARAAKGEIDSSTWQRFQLLKGDPKPEAPRVAMRYPDAERKDRKAAARGEVPILFLNSNMIKDQLDNMLNRKTDDDEGGRVTFCGSLSDSFYMELTVEIRTIKGWENPKQARNESWDLLCYSLALTLSKHIRIETIDWNNPPGWAKPYAENDLVFVEEKSGVKSFAQPTVSKYDLSKLGERLA